MKILVVETPYSNYFSELISALKNIDNEITSSVTVTYNKGIRVYLPRTSVIKPNFHYPYDESIVNIVKDIKNLVNLNSSLNQEQLEILCSFYAFLHDYLSREKIKFALVYNDLRWESSIAISLFKRLGINYIVFERGVFRPFTTTMDFSGVNANSSLLSENEVLWHNDCSDFTMKPGVPRKAIKLKFSIYFILKKIYGSLYNLGVLDTNRKGISDYVSLFFESTFKKGKKDKKGVSEVSYGNYIFVPLQLSNDTQTLLNSRFNSTQEFIDFVEENFYSSSFSEHYNLVFKVHPMDLSKYTFDKKSIQSTGATDILIKKSKLLITINSTVGFEALSTNVPVIVYGNSFYTGSPLVIEGHSMAFDTCLKSAFESPVDLDKRLSYINFAVRQSLRLSLYLFMRIIR